MSAPKLNWWDKLCMLVGLSWEVPDTPLSPAHSAALPSMPPVPPSQNTYRWGLRLQDLKLELLRGHRVALVEKTDDYAIADALARGDAIIVEVAAGTEAITIHALPPDDLDRFGSLAAWSAWQTSGREVAFDSTFYRVDVEPIEKDRVYRNERNLTGSIWISGPLKICPESDSEDDAGGAGVAPEIRRERGSDDDDGPVATPIPVRPRSPQSR